jgi:catechol 2,3-dioxygenase-like lactoylglutathione lyase family enzyme
MLEHMRMTGLIPMLPVQRLDRAVDFYCGKLGFQVERRRDDWGWAMLRLDAVRLMLDQSIHSPDRPPSAVIYLYPDDVAAYHAKVRGNGLALPDLDDTFYGHLEFRIEDPDGNRLWIGQAQTAAT